MAFLVAEYGLMLSIVSDVAAAYIELVGNWTDVWNLPSKAATRYRPPINFLTSALALEVVRGYKLPVPRGHWQPPRVLLMILSGRSRKKKTRFVFWLVEIQVQSSGRRQSWH